ncbi:MAG: acyl-protein synthetase, partial [Polyangiales bacterium]
RMLAWFVEELGAPGSRFVSPTAIDDAIATLETVTGPVVLLATAFAHVFLLDRLAGRTLPLAAGSRAMQTGGFKGRSREVAAEVLRSQIARAWGLDEASVVGEYGMTELTSQLWATPEVGSTRDRWLYAAPSWVRVTACDPITLAARPTGERGIARIEDLANVESAWAIQTADEVVVDARGHVELFGRLAGSTPRGCSLAIEELAE